MPSRRLSSQAFAAFVDVKRWIWTWINQSPGLSVARANRGCTQDGPDTSQPTHTCAYVRNYADTRTTKRAVVGSPYIQWGLVRPLPCLISSSETWVIFHESASMCYFAFVSRSRQQFCHAFNYVFKLSIFCAEWYTKGKRLSAKCSWTRQKERKSTI